MRVLFGTDGIRGKASQYPFDPPTMYALGEALAHRLEKKHVIMGMDTRESGIEIAAPHRGQHRWSVRLGERASDRRVHRSPTTDGVGIVFPGRSARGS